MKKRFYESAEIITNTGNLMVNSVILYADLIANAFKNGKKLMVAGNGGSAADAQHIAGELVNKFYEERKALPCFALSTDTSILTAVSNDYSFDYVFSRQIEAFGVKGDVFLAISTSGKSKNLIHTVKKAKDLGIITLGLLGKGGGELAKLCDYNLIVPCQDTPRIQEAHQVIYHTICEMVEQEMLRYKS